MIQGKCKGCGLVVSVTERVVREAPRAMCVACHQEVIWVPT